MCACRIEEKLSPQEMEEQYYNIYNMVQDRNTTPGSGGGGGDDVDVYSQLAQKDKDLILAAEVGKALLDKNTELKSAHDKLEAEFTDRLESLEQEKHGLRMRLEAVQGEYESKVLELQGDVQSIRSQLDTAHRALHTTDRDKSQLVSELSEQNHRITTQLAQTSAREVELSGQLNSLKETFNLKKSSIHEHVSQLECLRAEITILTERKTELEKRILIVEGERDNVCSNLDDAQDRILMLERQSLEQEQAMRVVERELDEARHTNMALQDRVDALVMEKTGPSNAESASLFNELSISQMLRDSEQFPRQPSSSGIEDDYIECDDDDISMTESHAMGYFARMPGGHNDEDTYQVAHQNFHPIHFKSTITPSWKFSNLKQNS